ncbi:MAG: Mth938-like domain-containing protein [Armatimonadota bacterium]
MIDDYSFGQIVIDGHKYTDDVIIYPGRVDDSWWREEGHRLKVADIETIIEADPEVLVVGTGAYGRVAIEPAVKQRLEDRGIELLSAPTEEACKKYNDICDDKKVVAALHLTC